QLPERGVLRKSLRHAPGLGGASGHGFSSHGISIVTRVRCGRVRQVSSTGHHTVKGVSRSYSVLAADGRRPGTRCAAAYTTAAARRRTPPRCWFGSPYRPDDLGSVLPQMATALVQSSRSPLNTSAGTGAFSGCSAQMVLPVA